MQSAKTVALFWGNGIGKTMKRKFQYQTRLSLLHWRFCCISSKSQDLQCHQASACKSAARLYKINDHIQLSETFSLTQLRHPGHWQEEDTCGGSVVTSSKHGQLGCQSRDRQHTSFVWIPIATIIGKERSP